MAQTPTPAAVKAAIWTGIFGIVIALITIWVNASHKSDAAPVTIGNSQNTVVGNNNTVNQSLIEDHPYDASRDTNVLEKYYNDRYHTTFFYPSQWQPGRLPDNGDGWTAKDPNGSATVTFYGSHEMRADASTFEEDDWNEYFEQLKPDDGAELLSKEETAMYYHSGKTKTPISAAIMTYNLAGTYYIKKTALYEDGCANFIVSCAISDKAKYRAIFAKMVNDIYIEAVEYQLVPAKK